MRPDLVAPLRLAGVYILFSTAWILGSDMLLNLLVADSHLVAGLQIIKGLLFVMLSSLLIFAVSYYDRQAQRRLLDQLTHNGRLLQQAQRTAALGYWEYRSGFHWSAEALQLLGQEADCELSGLEQLLSWLHPAERPAVRRALLALIEAHAPLAINARLYQPQRSENTWLTLRGETDSQGQILGTVQDISSQKRDEAALRESEQRFRQLFERSPRIAVQGYDREHRVIFWNEASSQLYGYSMQEALGKRLEELIIPPPARVQVQAAINSWLLGGPAIPAAELQLQRKDGSLVSVFSSHSMLRNTHNQLELYCIDIDLSEQKQVYGELLASEERFRDLVAQLSDAVFLADAHGHLTFHNPAWEQLSGYPGEESLGRPLSQFFIGEDGARLTAQIGAMTGNAANNLRGEYHLHTRHGRVRKVDLQLTRSLTDNSLRGSLRDTHRQVLSEQLQ